MTVHLLLTALGLYFLIEGAMYALNPRGMQKMMALAAQLPESQLRMIGVASAVLGFLIVGYMQS